ncbi:DUF4411 family protein [Acinetobacter baumannii]|uniref:DUF4411 family protein n=1 Tax=Acinetobacter baumannii TaxID=470 RepID=UPI00280C781E|nr:DUF4411 family protein [Acinetobacter baumannii]MDQ8923514.1 DUF4411 family protein [Acinetobacter baumannii]MDQ8926896.1 DUF4411 family protein [Acinetobacter baumannii]MDQ8933829.1 DUF4411 family protein [Acinetobacter baumannii]
MHTKYLLDTNIFIQSFNLSYHPSFCNGFWDWLVGGFKADKFYSIDKVYNEMIKPTSSQDELSQLLRSQSIPQEMFVESLSDPKVTTEYGKLMSWAFSNTHFLPKAKTEFARPDSADAHLIATAMAYNYVIVTEELSNPTAKARILIPDAAANFGISCITMPSLLRKHAHNNFTLK